MSAITVPTASLGASRKRRGNRVHPLFFFLALVAALLGMSEKLLLDPDTHWHIAVGRWIWESRSVPWIDVFSHTFAGAPWIAKEWLSQLIFYGAFAAAGWRGVAALTAIVIAASFALLFQWLRSRINSTAALVLTVLAFLLATISLHARPHVLVFPILILWTGGLVEAAARGSPPWRLVALMMLWANLHGSFTIGFALAGILAVEAMLTVPRQQRLAAALRWSVFLAAVVLAACATPYGYRAMWVTATLFGSGEPLRYIIEWQPLPFDWIGILACGMFISLFLGLALRPRENLFRIVVVVLFGYMMLRHQRFLCLFALVAPIVAAGPLARRFPSACGLSSGASDRRPSSLRGDRPSPSGARDRSPEIARAEPADDARRRPSGSARPWDRRPGIQRLQFRGLPDRPGREHLHRRAHRSALSRRLHQRIVCGGAGCRRNGLRKTP